MHRSLLIPVLAVLLVSCEEAPVFEPPQNALGDVASVTGQELVVMSRNLYLGADIDALLDPSADLPAVLAIALQQVLFTDFRERAKTLAQEIQSVGPHLVGLQEVTTYAVTTVDGTIVPAFGFPLDFLQALQSELAALGEDYVVAHRTANVSLTFPLGDLAPVPGLFITYADADAILARSDVTILASDGGNFEHQQQLSVGGFAFENLRGWAQVDAVVDDMTLRFASTHLEVQLFADVQEAQAGELIDILDDSPWPVVLVGDFNSAANHDAPQESRTGSYKMFRRAGYQDLWLREPHSVGGLTCCQFPDLSNTTSDLDQRLDIVFARVGAAGFGGQSRMELLGEETSDIFVHPLGYTLWPSDHAGIAAWITPAPGQLARF
jgi:endonuclease/exonuclease/phosphatase family metal-dependent hydrolase